MCISHNVAASWKNWGVTEHPEDGEALQALFKHVTERQIPNQYIVTTSNRRDNNNNNNDNNDNNSYSSNRSNFMRGRSGSLD